MPRFFFAIPLLFCFLFATAVLGKNEGRSLSTAIAGESQEPRVYNVNPDPRGEPWMAGGCRALAPEEVQLVPDLVLLPRGLAKAVLALPASFSNAGRKYLPPILNQGNGGSCAQAAGVGYNFNYAINQARDASAALAANRYPFLYTWNFLNNGNIEGGTTFLEGWSIINQNGIPNEPSFVVPTDANFFNKWMSGYANYLNAMKNRYVTPNKITISTPEGIATLKQWIYDLGTGAPFGAMASFSVNCLPMLWDFNNAVYRVPAGTPMAGKHIVWAWGDSGGHALNIIGWDDSVRYDVNKDGKYTNSIDITGDGIVDVRDWEIGAWQVINSWGTTWADAGYFYMSCRTGALDAKSGGFTSEKTAFTIKAHDVDTRQQQVLNYKVRISHSMRSDICLYAGVANNTGAAAPEFRFKLPLVNNQGGAYKMTGAASSQTWLEIGLDVKQLLEHVTGQNAKFFLIIESKGLGGTGTALAFSLMDHMGAAAVETVCPQANVPIVSGGSTVLSLTYQFPSSMLVINTNSLPVAVRGQGYNTQVSATGGLQPYAWTWQQELFTEKTPAAAFPQIATAVTPKDTDDCVIPADLGFDFPFYGQTTRKIFISTDGGILFDSVFSYVRNLESLKSTKAIAVLGADLTYSAASNDLICFSTTAASATIRWKTTHAFGIDSVKPANIDVAATLYPSGVIEFYYGSGMTSRSPGLVIGVSDGKEACVSHEYPAVDSIPANWKFSLQPVPVLQGISMSATGLVSGTTMSDTGTYRFNISVLDSLRIKKTNAATLRVTGSTGTAPPALIAPLPMAIVNHSSSSVLFSFGTDRTTPVSIEALNLSGKKIATIFAGTKTAGNHRFIWIPDEKNSRPVSNGAYFCRLSVGNKRLTKLVVMLK